MRTLVEAGPDAIQLSPGQAPLLQRLPGPGKPALVLRTDVANVYGPAPPKALWSELVEDAVGRALRLDAACVVVNLLSLPGEPELYRQCVHNVSTLRAACDPFGMPLMVEPLAMKPGDAGYGVNGDAETVVTLVRQAVELGADVIKADPTDDLDDYGRVVEAAGRVPVLVRGGGRAPDEEILAPHRGGPPAGRRRDRLRAQRRPARGSRRHDPRAHGDRARGLVCRAGARGPRRPCLSASSA